jgi:hypothetical protein
MKVNYQPASTDSRPAALFAPLRAVQFLPARMSGQRPNAWARGDEQDRGDRRSIQRWCPPYRLSRLASSDHSER